MHRRPGFIFATVLAMLVIVTIAVASLQSRINSEALLIANELDDYQNRHELLGIRDIAEYVAQTILPGSGGADRLGRFAASQRSMFRVRMPGGTALDIYATDLQGTLHLYPDTIGNDNARRLLERALESLEPPASRFTRGLGPARVSLRAASDEVLEAILMGAAGGSAGVRGGDAAPTIDADAYRVLDRARTDREMGTNTLDLREPLRATQLTHAEVESIVAAITLEPELWGLIVHAIEPNGDATWYEMAISREGTRYETRAWRRMGEEEAAEMGFAAARPDA
ncbi:MAG: hypothetical protein AAGI30_09130 [Planctomycetota bacterium]